jgi:two-component system chemotaxis sensor kinase CheA
VLEQNPRASEAIHAVFRAFHTIKGLAGFLEFGEIQEVAHEVETLLDEARNEKIAVTPKLVDAVLEAADYLQTSLLDVEQRMAGQAGQPVRDRHSLIGRIRGVSSDGVRSTPAPTAPIAEATANPVQTPAAAATPAHAPDAARTAEAKEQFTVRVDTQKLDHLMEALGELVIAQSMIRHNLVGTGSQTPALAANLAQLARITADVQRTTMAMRMVPVGQVFQRSNRLIRDLARKLGKKIVLDVYGEGTEVDKTIAEELSDPLMHMVRNAVDHGVEMPDARVAVGKDPVAHIRLSAYHKGAEIVVEIADDGKGLDRERILAKAVEKGLARKDVKLSEQEVFGLIFEPGFSTASQVTDLSGRGVGMDVVRRNLAKLRGKIDIESTPGKGATFYLRLPLTLAIIEGLVVAAGEQRFIIPVFAIREMVRVTPEMISTFRGQNEMALIRGQLLPIVRLYRRLGISSRSENLCDGMLVIAECEGKAFGIWIDDLLGRQELVIKSLGESLKDTPGVAGCAILGDGRVGLILDVASICKREQ